MDIGTLIQVVATIDAEIKNFNEMLNSEDCSFTYEEEYAIERSIKTLQNLADHFQCHIEAMVSAMESAQGM